MKALSLTAPWGILAVMRAKKWETRSWPTKVTGLIAIHSAKSFPGWAKQLCDTAAFRLSLRANGINSIGQITLGAIIGVANIVRCVPVEEIRDSLSEQERAFGDYSDARFAYELKDAWWIKPIPCKGALGFWNVSQGVEITIGQYLNAVED